MMRPFLAALPLCLIVGMPLPAQARCTGNTNASWYDEGPLTANGERFAPDGMTCAHRTLPFGAMVRLTDPATGRSAVCRINDRGPAKYTGCTIDASRGVARQLGMIVRGVARLLIERVS